MGEYRFLAYYVWSILQEERLSAALQAKGFKQVWRNSRLLSLEFCVLYYPVMFYGYGVFFPAVGEELRQRCLTERSCARYLTRSTPWWGGGQGPEIIDLADIQWREFRGALHLLLPAAAALAGLVRLATRWRGERGVGGALGVQVRAAVGVGFLLYIHGAGALFPLLLLLTFYALVRLAAGTRLLVPLAWLLALCAIAAKEPTWPIRRHLAFGAIGGQSWAFLDRQEYQGEYSWAESVNLIVLRVLSFAFDAHRAARARRQTAVAESEAKEHRPRYTLVQGLAHAFYAPLFLAGPTITFDDFVDQSLSPTPSKTSLAWYLLNLGAALVALDVGTRLYPCFALARSGLFGTMGPRMDLTACFLTLNLMWLKFLVIWRVGRAWALADGIDPPENMRRALCDHYSVASFWQDWHSSFNRWLVRYIYVPAGGRNRRILATTLTFLFVAYWHDAQAKLLAWGGLNALFIAAETIITRLGQRKAEALGLATRVPWLYRQLCAFGGATCIYLLCLVNIIGYSVGLDGVSSVMAKARAAGGEEAWVMAGFYIWFFCNVHVMFEIRRLDGTFAPPQPHNVAASPGNLGSGGGAPSEDKED